ncbi:MAG: PilZ domain-containing protein [Candidatus Omnitrophota bacterium]
MSIERREAPRFLLNLSVSEISGHGLLGKVVDFSRKGMRIILDAPALSERTDIQIAINRPDYNKQIFVIAYVAWIKPFEGKYEAGLKFRNIPPDAKADFLNYGYKLWLKNRLSC